MSGIVPMLLSEISASLDNRMRESIPEDDPSRANEVKVGRWQGDPVKAGIYLTICPGDPENPQWMDGIVTLETMHNVGFKIDPREVGGGQIWWRRGIIQLGCYFIREHFLEEQAIEYAYTTLARVQHHIETIPVTHLKDEHGEQAIKLFQYGYTFNESGGPPKSYIWRGKVLWQCLTEIP